MPRRKVFITRVDAARLADVLGTHHDRNWRDRENLRVLQHELARATIVDAEAIAPDVVTMHSTVRVLDARDNSSSEFTLVFPDETEKVYGGVSVLAPLGAAVLGFKAGDRIRFRTPGGERTVEIEEVLFQPEAAGQLAAA